MGRPVIASESLARFVWHRKRLSQDGRVKPSQFMPGPDGCLSVFRVPDPSTEAVRNVGNVHFRSPPPIAHALVIAEQVTDMKLQLDPDDDPEGHVGIVGWPELKEERMLLATRLADAAVVTKY